MKRVACVGEGFCRRGIFWTLNLRGAYIRGAFVGYSLGLGRDYCTRNCLDQLSWKEIYAQA